VKFVNMLRQRILQEKVVCFHNFWNTISVFLQHSPQINRISFYNTCTRTNGATGRNWPEIQGKPLVLARVYIFHGLFINGSGMFESARCPLAPAKRHLAAVARPEVLAILQQCSQQPTAPVCPVTMQRRAHGCNQCHFYEVF
jgi:hypothetical protein